VENDQPIKEDRLMDKESHGTNSDLRSGETDFCPMKYEIDDALQELGGSTGLFQILNSISSMLLFAVGSQFFYSIPFYQYYPSLNCYDDKGNSIPQCD
jgi:hypothetical protein